MNARVTLQITDLSDRRNQAQLASARAIEQARADQALEQLYNERVRANLSARLDIRVKKFLQSRPRS